MTYLLPLFPLGTVLFPGMVLRLHIFEERYRAMFACRADKDPIFGVVLTRSGREVADEPEVHTIGTAASLLKAVRYPDGRYDLAVRGGRRFRVLDGDWDAGYLTASIEWLEEGDPSDRSADDVTRLSGQVRRAFGDYLDALERTADIRIERADLGQQPRELGYDV